MRNNRQNINGWFETLPSSPEYGTFADLPADTHDWDCAHWELYHKRNLAYLGMQKAYDIIMVDFGNQGTWSDFHYCKYDCNFIQYFTDYQVPVENFISNIVCSVNDLGKVVKTTSQTASTLSKYMLPILLIGGIVVVANFKDIKKALI